KGWVNLLVRLRFCITIATAISYISSAYPKAFFRLTKDNPMWLYITKGGPVMIPIIAGSIVGVAVVIERFFVFRQTIKISSHEFVTHIFRLLKEGNRAGALDICDHYRSFPLAVLFKVGIERSSLPTARLEKILEQAGNNQIQKLEKRLSALIAIIGVEPLLGFLGTITGLIRAFSAWERAGADVTVSALAGACTRR
ncbi:MAG: MotA/TolQ/ExbB proton channel family protein, partial [Candidatus Omnitrophica bacterium]|nr:MotA/TolQ/ExbB proton channel family protein [Candidatus Omnitrophota bacterium]